MKATKLLRAALLLCVTAAMAAPSVCGTGKESYALIYGTLWGPDSRPVYGVHMKLRRAEEKKFRWEALSDHHGEFAFRVPPVKGTYILVPELKHSNDKPLPETRIHVEGDERVDVGVHLSE
jgi:hypothetical protein